LSYDNLCEKDLAIVVELIVSEKVKTILTNFCEKGYKAVPFKNKGPGDSMS